MPIIIIISVVLIDQITKFWIARELFLGESFPVIKNIFHLTLVHNTGIAFGLGKGNTTIFIIISLIAVWLLVYSLLKKEISGFGAASLARLSLSLILAGALGNLIDRLRFGYVIDFLDLRVWPVFNVADSAITIAAILLCTQIVFRKKKCIPSS